MKRVQITIYPQGLDNPSLYEHLTDASYISEVRTVNWNNETPPAGFLLWIRGDYQRLEDRLAAESGISDYEILPLSDDECHCFLEGAGTADARRLWSNFNRGSMMTVPPVEWNADGSSTFVLVGTEADIQAAIEGVPEDIPVDVERVGGTAVRPESVRGALSNRQRETLETAVSEGYYETPREATIEDIAAEMGCAHSTAAESLQRAESKIILSLFDS
ncbi:helix-turn-helix domain-containing protein [Natronomonas salina]|uniref:helix-turn-helix domain-containing protein n=1 Tax=Natronomonas salina TaxID=1710540 RepID=UPI0015B72D0D|nr:helix-turn-helix domain-containing protein [Natronomonas salina]QLD90346.1 helix-turn-helix domain-containing protein [Natronomonas salina]